MIPKCLERKLDELQAICAEHNLYFVWVAVDEDGDFLYRSRGDDAFLVTATAVILRLLPEEQSELTEAMRALELDEYQSFQEGAPDDDELSDDLEDFLED